MSSPAQARMISRTAALGVAAAIMLVPANVLPVMRTAVVGEKSIDATILSGVKLLWEENLWGLAAIVFIASVVVPLLKLIGISRLLFAVHRGDPSRARRLSRLHAGLDVIGRWSMLDVFLVAFLAGAVRFGNLAHIEPRSGIIAFAAVVALTMLATHAFDPQALWEEAKPAPDPVSK